MDGRTTRDQVRGHDKIIERADQSRFGGQVEDVTEGGNDRKRHMVNVLA